MLNRSGFSLVRAIVILAACALAAVLLFILFNPARRIRAERNARRTADIALILNAVQEYRTKNGILPTEIDTDPTSVQIIGQNPGACGAVRCHDDRLPMEGCAIADFEAVLQPFLTRVPVDPKSGTNGDSRYYINRNEDGTVTVGACDNEGMDPSDTLPPPRLEITR